MLVGEFSKDYLNLGDVQFAVGIVLSFLHEPAASLAVIGFKGTYMNGELSELEAQTLRDERDSIEKEILQTGEDIVSGFVRYVCSKNCLPKVDASGHHKIVRLVNLEDLLKDKSCLKKIYTETMRLLFRNTVNDLIAVYVDTDEFKQVFKHDISYKYGLSADRHRRNDVSDSIINEIRADFKDFVRKNSANGSYSPISGTPVPFLRSAFNFYSKSINIQNILNTCGTNLDVGGDGDMSLIDFHTLSTKKGKAVFDFIDVANRINRASYLLFNHNHEDVAFFDILSCYRESKLYARMRSDKKRFDSVLRGCSVRFVDSSSQLICGNENTINNKKMSRIELCKIFSPIVENGLSQSEIYSYYRKVIELTGATDNHDGRRLFSYVDLETGISIGGTNHVENNSQMFQIIINGHLALKELVDYLNSDNSVATVYNFPTVIFRNREYLCRFKTIEEYCAYVYDVSDLVEEVRNDSERREEIRDGFISNDAMWKFLGNNNLMYDDMFEKLASMPLSFIKSAVSNSLVISQDSKFEICFRDLLDAMDDMAAIMEQMDVKGGLQDGYAKMKWYYSAFNSESFSEKSELYQYAVVLAFYRCLKKVLTAEGKPPMDKDGYYLYREGSVVAELKNMNPALKKIYNENESVMKQYDLQASIRSLSITKVYQIVTGLKLASVCNWEELRNFFCVLELLDGLFRKLYTEGIKKVNQQVRQCKDYAFLIVAKMAENKEVFSLPKIVVSCNELSFLYRDKSVCEFYIGNIKSMEENIEINDRRNKLLVTAVNRFLSAFGERYDAFDLGMKLLDKYVSTEYAAVTVETEAGKLLEKAAREVYSFSNSLIVDSRLRDRLKSIATCDEYGYVLRNGVRCDLHDDETFVLASGILVKLSPGHKDYSYDVMGEADMIQLMNKLALEM